MKLKRPKFKNFKAGDFPEEGIFDVVELKYDGWWGQLLMEGHKWQIFSRTGMLKKEGTLREPVGRTLIHGEYCYGTEWSKDHPEYYDTIAAHGAEMLHGKDVSKWENDKVRRYLESFLLSLQGEKIQNGVFLVDQAPFDKVEEVWDHFTDFEGLVFKDSQAPWGGGFGRMKRDFSMDYVCLGFKQSESDRHAGWGVASIIGGLTFPGQKGPTEACVVSGLNDIDRRDFFDNPTAYVGRVFEASGKKITKNGALRHPDFIRWRTDKLAEECTWKGEVK